MTVSARGHLTLAMVVVGGVSFLGALLAIDARATYAARTTADEPQYLLTALSLGEDLDLDISDELSEQAYLPFHEVRVNEQTVDLNESGQRLSPHDPLLPVLLAVPMRIGGWWAAKATLAVTAGLAAAATLWVSVRRFHVGLMAAAVVVGAFFLSPPLVSYGSQVYPEMPAALALIVGTAAATGALRTRGILVVLVAVVALPWLAAKYIPVAAVLALTALAGLWVRRRKREAVLSAGVLVLVGVVYLVVHQRVYGGWTVYAAGDHFVDGEFEVVGSNPDYWGRSRRVIGLLVDEAFGLAAWAPAYVALIPAVAVLVQRRVSPAVPLLALLATGWFMATWVALTMHGWWWPGRQLVVVLPLAVVAVAALAEASRAWFGFVVVAAGLSAASWAWVVVEASTDRLTLIVDFFDTTNPWYRVWSRFLPDHMDPGPGDLLLTLLWVFVLGGLTVVTVRSLGKAGKPEAGAVEPVGGPPR